MKKTMIKNLASFLCVAVLFFAVQEGFRYILTDDTSSYTRIMFHQLYNSDENIDIAFVGSSHVYRSLVPAITDKGFNAYTFNCGTSSQPMDGSLAIVKDVIARNDVDTIYLETFFVIASLPDCQDRTEMTSIYIISDYMKPSIRKWEYLLRASSKDYWVNGFILARRNWEQLFDVDYIMDLIAKKSDDSYKNYEWVKQPNDEEYYVDRGFVANDSVMDDTPWIPAMNGSINMEAISNDWINSLHEIIEVCNKNNVKLVLFLAPMTEWHLMCAGNYDDYHCFIQEQADNASIEFYDFNLLSNNHLFSTAENKYFMDVYHLNTYGAEAFSKVFCDFFANPNDEIVLFDSFEDKLQNELPYVYGVSTLIDDQNAAVKTGSMVANRSTGIEYRIEVFTADGEARILQDFSASSEITLPIDEHGTLKITWRTSDQACKPATIVLPY